MECWSIGLLGSECITSLSIMLLLQFIESVIDKILEFVRRRTPDRRESIPDRAAAPKSPPPRFQSEESLHADSQDSRKQS